MAKDVKVRVHCKKGCSHLGRKFGPPTERGEFMVTLDGAPYPVPVAAEDIEILDTESLS